MDKVYELGKAKFLMRTLGVRCAAGYMRNRGWSIESALYNLLRAGGRDQTSHA